MCWGPTFPQLSSLCAGDIAEVVFDLCGDISECLDRLHLGTLLGYLLTRDGWGCLGHIFFWGEGHLLKGLGNGAKERAVRAFILDPFLHRRRVPMLSECAKPRVLAGTSGLLHQPCPEPAPPTSENADQTAVLTPTPSCYSSPQKQKGSCYTDHDLCFQGTPICP